MDILKSPFVVAASAMRSFWDSSVGALTGLFEGGIKGGLLFTGVAALGSIFKPTIESALEHVGQPQLFDAIAPYLETNGDMGAYLMDAFQTGAVVGGVMGAGSAVSQSLVGGVTPLAEEGELRTAQMMTNTGNLLGNGAVAAATGLLAVQAFEHVTGVSLGSLMADTPASETVEEVASHPSPVTR